jgi:hypothetical protein
MPLYFLIAGNFKRMFLSYWEIPVLNWLMTKGLVVACVLLTSQL